MNTFVVSSLGGDDCVEITFSVKEKNSRYHTTFEYKFDDKYTEQGKIKLMKHLELYNNDLEDFYSGDIIYKNDLSEKLISYMLLSDEELKKYSGNVMEECYRLSLIHIIKLLWD